MEAITEERDFFREKYIAQVDEIKQLQNELRLARKEIARLREDLMVSVESKAQLSSPIGIVDVEVEEKSPHSYSSPRKGNNNELTTAATSVITTATALLSVADVSCESKESVEQYYDEKKKSSSLQVQDESTNDTSDLSEPSDEKYDDGGEEYDYDEGSDEDSDCPDAIRNRAAKMLLWANYQTARSASVNISFSEFQD